MNLFFKKGIQDIPMTQEIGKQYLPWIIGLLVLLLLLVFTCASSIGGTLLRWHGGFNNKLTIEVPFADATVTGAEKTASPVIQQILSFAQTIPGVLRVEVVENERLIALLRPWVGQSEVLQDLEMPTLIDLEIDPGATLDFEGLKQHLRGISQGVRVEAYTRWHQMLAVMGQAIKTLSYAIVGFILGAIFIVISLMTKSSLAAYQENIDILRLIGAKNSYITWQFQVQAFKACFQGGLIGIMFALPILYFLSWLARYLGIPEIFKDMPSTEVLVGVLALPLAISILSMIVSRVTVLRTLVRLDR